jgi:hypothetical protein
MKATKAIQVDSKLHNDLKVYCVSNGIVLQKLVEKLIESELSKSIRRNNTKSKI